jgi:hypothetical protein
MIKINLLPQKRGKLRASSGEPGARDMVLGIGAILVAAAAVFLFVDQPKRSHVSEIQETNRQQIAQKRQKLDGYEGLKKAADDANDRAMAINRLMNAKVVPANVLHELGEILTQGHLPTMTEAMTRKTGNNGDPNKRFDLTWDPTHVWMTSFTDKNGDFSIEGGAQAEVDVTQLSKRLAASVYFDDVSPSRQERVSDKDTGLTYYKFTITGKVAY